MNVEGEIPDIDEPYTQAVDDRLIAKFVDRFPTGFVFLYVDPAIAYRRLKGREKNIEDEAVTVEAVEERQRAERRHFDGIIENFGVDADYWIVIDNSRDGEAGKEQVVQFIESMRGDGCGLDALL